MRAGSLLRNVAGVGVALVLAAATGVAPAHASAAGAPALRPAAQTLNPTSHIHVMPTRSMAGSMEMNARPFVTPPLLFTYFGGAVMQAGTRTVPIFWEPTHLQDGSASGVDPNYNSLIQRFLGDIGGHGLYNLVTQYYQDNGHGVQYIVNSSGVLMAIVDTSSYPSATGACSTNGITNCITDAAIQAEVAKQITAHSLPRDYKTLYPVFTDRLEASCADATDCFDPAPPQTNWVYCAYHGSFTMGGQPVLYANMPYVDSNSDSIAGCANNATHPNSAAFDDETSALSHEFIEAVTDPDGQGWFDLITGYEIGDICIGDGAQVTWGGNPYFVQTEWSDAVGDCLPGHNNQISLSPASGASGSSTTVTGTGFTASHAVTLSFSDAAGTVASLGATTSNASGAISQVVTIPIGAVTGLGTLDATGATADDGASAGFTVGGSPATFALTVSKAGSGTGSVASNPAGVSCGATCQASFATGTPVTVTATPDASSTFAGWSGSGCSGTGTCQVSMTQARSVTATFTLKTFALSVSKTGAGIGTVTSNPAAISCGATCQANFTYNTSVDLAAVPDASSTFAGWSGDCSGTGTCTVLMTAAHSVTADFTPNTSTTFALTVSKAGTGAGGVTSVPGGIDCGIACQFDFASGTPLTLTATPDAFSTFAGWSGACTGTGSCQVTMSQAQSVTATFAAGYRPDAQLSFRTGPYVGDNIYNTTGASQSKSVISSRGTTATFHWKIRNRGTLTDRIMFAAPGNSSGFTVRFYLGTANVTSAVVAGTYEKTLAPGASLTITVKIGVLTGATIGAVKSERLSAMSLKQPLVDVVLAKVTAR